MLVYQTYKSLIKKKFNQGNVYFFIFIAYFFLESCSSSSITQSDTNSLKNTNLHITEEDHIWMEEFFQEFFLSGSTIYTLFGTKPISGIIISYATEEECKKSALHYIEREGLDETEKKKILLEISKSCREDDFSEKWAKWISFIKQFPDSPFLFAKHPTRTKNLWTGHILNVQETVWTLQKNYELFRKEIGFDFDPIVATLDFTNENSLFWKLVFSNHLLTGIVYGYGYKNSFFFDLLMKSTDSFRKKHCLFCSIDRTPSKVRNTYSISNLPLPTFRSFRLPFNDDPVLKKYELERNKIQKKLNMENFFDIILLQITGKFTKDYQE